MRIPILALTLLAGLASSVSPCTLAAAPLLVGYALYLAIEMAGWLR